MAVLVSRSRWLLAVWLSACGAACVRCGAVGTMAARHDALALSLSVVGGLGLLAWCWSNRLTLRRLGSDG